MATHSSIFAWAGYRGAQPATVHGVAESDTTEATQQQQQGGGNGKEDMQQGKSRKKRVENLEEHTTGKNSMEQALKTPQNQTVQLQTGKNEKQSMENEQNVQQIPRVQRKKKSEKKKT